MKFFKHGFTLLEVIFVIIILGIVASIGSTIVAQLFDNYLTQRAVQRVSLKTELAASQIANRLAYAIGSSVIVRDGVNPNNFMSLENFPHGATRTTPQTLEWIGYDNDSFSSRQLPGWSGYCDTAATRASIVGGNRNRIITPGSGLGYADVVIQNLSNSATRLRDAALLFSVRGQHTALLGASQNPGCYGYTGSYFVDIAGGGVASNNNCIYRIAGLNGQTTLVTDNPILANTNISPKYKLAWSAYALVPVNIRRATNANSALFDLELRYNFQPWDGDRFDAPATQRSTLIRNVTSFKYSQLGGTIRFKICATEQINGNSTDDVTAQNISICKEKVVLR